MPNIRIDLNHAPLDGETVSFKAPCNASDITGMVIYYQNDAGTQASREFTLNDANGGDIGLIDNIFAEGAIVKVILDTDANNAFVQNPDTNTYLEGELAKKYSPDNKPSPSDIGAAPSGFGLGGAPDYIYNCNTAIDCGFYKWDTADNAPFSYAAMLVIARHKNDCCVQVAFRHDGGSMVIATRRAYYGNTGSMYWEPWEYINPPMEVGVEYRTTERYQDKPVYVKLVLFGLLPDNGGKDVLFYDGDDIQQSFIDLSRSFIGINQIGQNYGPDNLGIVNCYTTGNKIYIQTNINCSNTGIGAHICVKYTKTTD